jgi:hypothetical protein
MEERAGTLPEQHNRDDHGGRQGDPDAPLPQ